MASVLSVIIPRRLQDKALQKLSALQRVYRCRCKRPVFFANSQCLYCATPLGYDPQLGRVIPLDPGSSPNTWVSAVPPARTARAYLRCANLNTPAGCNWLLRDGPAARKANGFCVACRLNRTIPDLSIPENGVLWGRIEAAKRRVISLLVALDLPLASRVSEDPERGLAFDLLHPGADGAPILTGHADGVITLNIEEAEDARREQIRNEMHEPYRTLVGHFRHEIGHYYWYRLVADTPWLTGFRELFGDETTDYAAALRTNYEQGPRPDWASYFVSSYASIHPWEDWAETWAHYLHMIDTVGTASSFGIRTEAVDLRFDRFSSDALYQPNHPGAGQFLSLLNAWIELTAAMNELSRSMGQPDFYPFTLPKAAVAKLQFIHMLVSSV